MEANEGDVCMDEARVRVEDIMRRHGLAEDEANALYHLLEAQYLFEKWESPLAFSITALPHFYALQNILARRLVKREHPEGWGGADEE